MAKKKQKKGAPADDRRQVAEIQDNLVRHEDGTITVKESGDLFVVE